MQIRTIAQWTLSGNVIRRFGDCLADALFDVRYVRFTFAVAYMRRSGLDRIMPGIEALLNRGGSISAAVGIDDAITSADALDDILALSKTSTVLHSDSGPIAHPKVFVFEGPDNALVIVGSANLTRDGLFRNIEFGIELLFDLQAPADRAVFVNFCQDLDGLLRVGPNSQTLTALLLKDLEADGKVLRERATRDPSFSPRRGGPFLAAGGATSFPAMRLPAAPPPIRRVSAARIARRAPPLSVAASSVFVMQLSAFDSSHRTGVPGTPEVLIPNDAMGFFPNPESHGRRYDDARVTVIVDHPDAPELHDYRLWIYPARVENRLRMDHRTLDLSTPAGGDLLVISRIVSPDADYAATILRPTDVTYGYYSSLCTRTSNGKHWGIV